MAGSSEAINKVLSHEGGYVNHPADKGGPTNYGITQKVYSEFLKRSATIDDMKNMPIADARAIYKIGYWDKIGGDSIKNYATAYTIFDQAVNRGVQSALKQVQTILGLSPTGILTGGLITALNNTDQKSFLEKYLKASEDFYKAIVTRDPSQAVFLAGWLNRISSLKSYAQSNLDLITSTISQNPWIFAVPAVAMAGLIGYYVIKQGQKNGRIQYA